MNTELSRNFVSGKVGVDGLCIIILFGISFGCCKTRARYALLGLVSDPAAALSGGQAVNARQARREHREPMGLGRFLYHSIEACMVKCYNPLA